MKTFIDRFSDLVKGTLTGFDRIVFNTDFRGRFSVNISPFPGKVRDSQVRIVPCLKS